MSSLFVGIDLGTSAVKVGVFDASGEPLRLVRQTYSLYSPRPGWTEQEPRDWWAATCTGLQEALSGTDASRIAAVGLSGQAPGHVLAAAGGTSLGRAIIWSDQRATAETAWLQEHITPQQAAQWTGASFIYDVTQPPARLLWLRRNRPADWDRAKVVLQPKDFIALCLTGEAATDHHSSYALFDSQTNQYHSDYFAVLGIEKEKMPAVLPATGIVGHVHAAAAKSTTLPAGTPVVTGTIDAWCDIIGCGGIAPGQAVDVAGTSEVVALVTDHPAEGDGVFSSALLGGLYWIGGPMQAGGATLVWLARSFYGRGTRLQEPEAEAASVPPGADGLLFLPYLRGERAPLWDTKARGAFVGLTHRHTRAHCARAVYEGVAFAVCSILERSQAAAGLRARTLRVSGGGARSALWNQIKADIVGLPVQRMAVSDAACLGAALLGAVGVEAFSDTGAAAEAMVHPADVYAPTEETDAVYPNLFAVWKDLYPALRSCFARLDEMRMNHDQE
jgi:xylulokinase